MPTLHNPVPRPSTAGTWLLAAGLLLPLAPSRAQEPASRLEIVDRAIEHHGGERYRHGDFSLTARSRSGAFRIEGTVDGGLARWTVAGEVRDSLRKVTISNFPGEEEARWWEDGVETSLDADGRRRARDFVMARVYFPFLPYRLNDPSVGKIDRGLETWGERQLHRVKVVFEAGTSSAADDEYTFWFDPATARLEQYAYSYATGTPRAGLRFRRLSNYRREAGILVFDLENLGIDGSAELTVDLLDPDFVAQKLEPVSTLALEDLRFDTHMAGE